MSTNVLGDLIAPREERHKKFCQRLNATIEGLPVEQSAALWSDLAFFLNDRNTDVVTEEELRDMLDAIIVGLT